MTLQEHQQDLVEKIASGSQYGGAGGAVFFGLSANEFAAIAGVCIALAGFFVNWYYKHKADRRAERGGQIG